MNSHLLYFDYYIDGENLSFRMDGNDMYLYIPSNNDQKPQYEVMYKIINISQFMTTRWQCVYSGRQNRYYYEIMKDGILSIDEKGYGNYIFKFYDWGIIEFWADRVEKVELNYDWIVGEIEQNSCCYDGNKLYYEMLFFVHINKILYRHYEVQEHEVVEVPNSEWAKNDFYVSSYHEKDLEIGREPLNHYRLKVKNLGCFEILAEGLTPHNAALVVDNRRWYMYRGRRGYTKQGKPILIDLRIMEPTREYPNGCIRYTNANGQPFILQPDGTFQSSTIDATMHFLTKQ